MDIFWGLAAEKLYSDQAGRSKDEISLHLWYSQYSEITLPVQTPPGDRRRHLRHDCLLLSFLLSLSGFISISAFFRSLARCIFHHPLIPTSPDISIFHVNFTLLPALVVVMNWNLSSKTTNLEARWTPEVVVGTWMCFTTWLPTLAEDFMDVYSNGWISLNSFCSRLGQGTPTEHIISLHLCFSFATSIVEFLSFPCLHFTSDYANILTRAGVLNVQCECVDLHVLEQFKSRHGQQVSKLPTSY